MPILLWIPVYFLGRLTIELIGIDYEVNAIKEAKSLTCELLVHPAPKKEMWYDKDR